MSLWSDMTRGERERDSCDNYNSSAGGSVLLQRGHIYIYIYIYICNDWFEIE